MAQKKRDCISIETRYSTTWKCFSIITLIGMGGLLAQMVEENDLCIQHENVLWTA